MKKYVLLTVVLLMLLHLVGCSGAQNDPISDTLANTPTGSSPAQEADPTDSSQPTAGTEGSVSVEPTEAETTAPRQEGTRLSSEQLAYYNALFGPKGNESLDRVYHSYYNLALARPFASAQELSLNTFFSLGFSNEWSTPITDAERAFYAKALGYDEFPLDMQRLPKELVEYVLDYYFYEDMDVSALVYNPDTQCYYVPSSGAPQYPNISFTDGYFDEATGLVSLYYTHVYLGEEYIVTIQSKQNLGETGYYIISNLPAA